DAANVAADNHRSLLEEAGRIVNLLPDTGNAILGGARSIAGFYSLSAEDQDRAIEEFVDTYGTGMRAIQNDPGAAAQMYVRLVTNMTNHAAQIGTMEGAGSFMNTIAKGGGLTKTMQKIREDAKPTDGLSTGGKSVGGGEDGNGNIGGSENHLNG